MARCKSCEQPISWATSPAGGGYMPLDETPVENAPRSAFFAAPVARTDKPPTALYSFVNGKARYATDEDRRLHRPLYASHFDTCPDGNLGRA